MKRVLSLLMVLTLLFTAVPAAIAQENTLQIVLENIDTIRAACNAAFTVTAEQKEAAQALQQVASMEEAEVPMYVMLSTIKDMQKVHFFNGNRSVAYMEIGELFDILKTFRSADPGFLLNGVYGDQCYLSMRENNHYALVDFMNGTVFFSDYDLFGRSASAVSGGDILASPVWQTKEDGSILTDENGQPLVNLYKRLENDRNFTRYGYSLTLPLALNHIPLYWADGKGYMPVTTFGDLFLSDAGYSFIFNGETLFVTPKTGFDSTVANEDGKTMQDLVYEGARERTKELAEFTYWEMVMMLEGNYGLREEHQIGDDFDAYFSSIGLKERLLSQDGATFSDALVELTMGYFGDLHSGVTQGSPFAGADYVVDILSAGNLSGSIMSSVNNQRRYAVARSASTSVDENGAIIPYLEVGDTAYITFDSFVKDFTKNYYDPAVQETLPDSLADDNIALIHYANEQINRTNSPIKKVVIDLSLNGGGMADAAFYVISWVLGTCHFSTVNPISKAQYTVGYQADVDFDGYITEADALDLSKVKAYCLISGSSFSCGNLAPAAFKESGVVTLLGQKSGGGACVVDRAIAADGTVYQYSSRYRLSTVKNGSYYSIDEGVDPDFVISDPAHLYDRAWLTEYLAQLP